LHLCLRKVGCQVHCLRSMNSIRRYIKASSKLVIQLSVAVLFCAFAKSAEASASETIFTSETTGNIYEIDAAGVSTELGTSGALAGHFWNGAAYNPTNGLIYVADIGTTNYHANVVITNVIYSFNPSNPDGTLTEVGTISSDAITGAGFHNGKYYTIGSGANTLTSYTLPSSGTSLLTAASTQTLGNLGNDGSGTAIKGLSLGDLDFKGNSLYISAGTVTSTAANATINNTYILYEYADVSNLTTPTLMHTESKVGVGIGYDALTNTMTILNSDNTIDTINQTTGAVLSSVTITGPDTGGAGDYTILTGVVPEPRDYAVICLGLILAIVALQRFLLQQQIRLSCQA